MSGLMPNRVIKESLRYSDSCSQMSAEEERHWVRGILLGVDDHGCLEITPAILRGAAYPLHTGVTEQQIVGWNARLEQLGVIRTWRVGFHQYAEVTNWSNHSGRAYTDEGKQTRNRRKTPLPPDWQKIIQSKPTTTSLYNDKGLGHTRPDAASLGQPGASLGPGMGMVPGMGMNDLSTNVEVDNTSAPDPSADRSGNDQGPGEAPEPERRLHQNPAVEIDLLVDYQTEVLNKLDGVRTATERKDRPTLLAIARHVPRSIVHAALEATQDARLRAIGAKQVSHAAYFVAGVKTRCAQAGIQSPFGKSSEMSSENMRRSEAAAPS